MSDELDKDMVASMNSGAQVMGHSLISYVSFNPKFKKKITKQQARDNYCKSVLFLWGFMQFDFDKVDDDMFNRGQLVSAYLLFGLLSRKEYEGFYLGAGLSKKKNKDFPKLCIEIVEWFNENQKLPGVQSIITTGKHVFSLMAFSGKLEEKHIEAFYRMGSLCEEGQEVISCMKSILVDSKLKLYF